MSRKRKRPHRRERSSGRHGGGRPDGHVRTFRRRVNAMLAESAPDVAPMTLDAARALVERLRDEAVARLRIHGRARGIDMNDDQLAVLGAHIELHLCGYVQEDDGEVFKLSDSTRRIVDAVVQESMQELIESGE